MQSEVVWFWQPGVRLALIAPWECEAAPTLEVVGITTPYLDAGAVRITVWWQHLVEAGLIVWGPAVQVAEVTMPLTRAPGAAQSMGRAVLTGCDWLRASCCYYKIEPITGFFFRCLGLFQKNCLFFRAFQPVHLVTLTGAGSPRSQTAPVCIEKSIQGHRT